MNPINRDPATLKKQVREFIKGVEKRINRAGGACRLTSVLRVFEDKHYTLVSYRPLTENDSAPIAVIETVELFKDKKKAENEITTQLHYALKKIEKKLRAA